MDGCTELLFKQIHMPIDKYTFKTLAKIASCDIIFDTHDGLYRQVDGLAMGNPHVDGNSPCPHVREILIFILDT